MNINIYYINIQKRKKIWLIYQIKKTHCRLHNSKTDFNPPTKIIEGEVKQHHLGNQLKINTLSIHLQNKIQKWSDTESEQSKVRCVKIASNICKKNEIFGIILLDKKVMKALWHPHASQSRGGWNSIIERATGCP